MSLAVVMRGRMTFMTETEHDQQDVHAPLSEEELESTSGEALPDRVVMSLILPPEIAGDPPMTTPGGPPDSI